MENIGDATSVGSHYSYGQSDLWSRIESALRANGLDPENLTPEVLTPLDQFHSRGRRATLDLADISGISRDMRVLDVGGGLGGPARILAFHVGCFVEVLDLTKEFCEAGTELTRRTKLSDLVHFTHGNALDIPFPADAFDALWTQHSTMNIPDKPELYSEMRRVLKPGGILAMHEIFAVSGDIHFPVPWAGDPSMSHLVTQDEARDIIVRAGFEEIKWIDETEESARWFADRAASAENTPETKAPPLGLGIVLGDSFGEMFLNQTRNLGEGKISVARGVFEVAALR